MVKIILGLAIIFLALAVIMTAWRVVLGNANDARLRAMKAAGEPASARELDAWYAAVDEKENAALAWLEGIAKLNPPLEKDTPVPWGKIKMPARGQRLNAPQLQQAAELIAQNQTALAIFRRAATLPGSRYPADLSQGAFAELPHLSPLKSSVNLLQLEALVHAQNGRGREAAEAIQAMLGAGRSLAQEPIVISQLVRSAMDYLAVASTERALNLTTLAEPQLAALQAAFAEAETPNLSTRALVGERASSITVLTSPKDLTVPNEPGAAEAVRTAQKSFGSSAMRATGIMQRDLGFLIDALGTNIIISKLPDPELFNARASVDAISMRARQGYYVMSSMLLPALSRIAVKDVEHRARLRVARTAMAVERYRLANSGKLPSSLDALTPKFLSAVPADPFDGEPLRFKTTATGYVIYSLGQDLKDDDGLPLPSGSQPEKTPHDIPFTVER
jgi:hypothetical protein